MCVLQGEQINKTDEQIPEWKKIEKNISYISSTTNPLSANVTVIEGQEHILIYDVGSHENIPKMLLELSNETGKDIRIVLSHFHPDHIANLNLAEWSVLYQGKNTYKYTQMGEVVENEIYLNDGDVNLCIFQIPSSHAKGSLALNINEKYCLLGDALYPAHKRDKTVYNAGILKQQIEILKKISTSYFLISHKEPFLQKKQGVILWLEKIYAMREKNEPWIEI